MRPFLGTVLSGQLVVLCAMAAASAQTTTTAPAVIPAGNAVTSPVWTTPIPFGAYPRSFPWADYRSKVTLRCRVAGPVLAECRSVESTPDSFLNAAISAAQTARIAPQDAAGAPTEGREIEVSVVFPIPVAVDPPPAPPSPVLTGVVWLERPSAGDFGRYFPVQAYRDHVQGRVILDCLVGGNGRLSCTVLLEEPTGYGFGEASLRLSRAFQSAPQTSTGANTAGARLRLPIRWAIADPPPPPPGPPPPP